MYMIGSFMTMGNSEHRMHYMREIKVPRNYTPKTLFRTQKIHVKL